MNDDELTPRRLLVSLEALVKEWEILAKKAVSTAQKGGLGDKPASYFNGVATGLQRAISETRSLIKTSRETLAAEAGSTEPGVQVAYAKVYDFQVEALLQDNDMQFKKLYMDKDFVWTALFAAVGLQTVEQKVEQLKALNESIVILDSGRLPDSGETYIDFAFTEPLLY